MSAHLLRNATIAAMAFLAGSCVSVGRIQETKPVQAMVFKGSHKDVAQCIHQRIGGQVRDEGFGERYVIYDAVKSKRADGLTHYAISVGRIGPDQGYVQWRILVPPVSGPPSGPMRPTTPLSDAAVRDYWGPVEECVARSKAPA